MLAVSQILIVLLLAVTIAGQSAIAPTTPVVSMLSMIPGCSVQCFIENLFESGNCSMTDARDLAACACTDIKMQTELFICLQRSCGFLDKEYLFKFANGLCAAYPKESRSNELKTTSIVTITLSITSLLLRLYSKWFKTRRLWSDDAYATIATIFLITVSTIILMMSLKGFGLHYWNVLTANAVELVKLYYTCEMLYLSVQVFSKVAILVFYSRLFPEFIQWFRWSVRSMIAFVFVHYLVFLLLIIFQCWPIRSPWDKTITDAKCIPIPATIGTTGTVINIAVDIIILLLPLPVILKLQVSIRKKIGVIFLTSVGSFACITSLVRLKFAVKFSNSYDPTWDNIDVTKWRMIEILSACICGNFLPLRPLFQQTIPHFHSIFMWRSDRRSSNKSKKNPFRSFGRLSPHGSSRKPTLISTHYFPRISPSSISISGYDQNNSTNSGQSTILSPRVPAPVYFEKKFKNSGGNYTGFVV